MTETDKKMSSFEKFWKNEAFAIIQENRELKKENRKLKEEVDKLEKDIDTLTGWLSSA